MAEQLFLVMVELEIEGVDLLVAGKVDARARKATPY